MKLVKDYEVGVSFWNVNPQLTKMGPFAKLYSRDKSRGKSKSSDQAWGIFMYAENSERSLFANLPEKKKKEVIQESFGVDFRGKIINECIEFYKEYCFSPIEKMLMQYETFLKRRTEFITTTDYNLESSERLDRAAASSKKIWEEYLKIKEEFDKSVEMTRVEGGRELSALEKGLI